MNNPSSLERLPAARHRALPWPGALALATALLLSLAATPLKPADELATLKWPRSFSLDPGETASFGFPVTQPGPVSAEITWIGGQLNVALVDPAGKTAAPARLQPSPARLAYSVAPADVSKGVIWFIRLSAPASATGKLAAQGKITVTYPPFDGVKAQAALAQMQARLAGAAKRPPLPQGKTSRLSAAKPAPQDRARQKAQLEATLQAKMATQMQQVNALRSKTLADLQARTALKINPVTRQPAIPAGSSLAGKLGAKPPLLSNNPLISEILPAQGFTGDKVVISGFNFRPDPADNKISFYVETDNPPQSASLPAVPSSIVQKADKSTTFTVTVPPLSGFPHPTRSHVQIDTVSTPFTATGPEFNWADVPVATVSAIKPLAARIDDWITVLGANFTAGTKIRFVVPDTGDVSPATLKLVGPGEIKVQVPTYLAKTERPAELYAQSVAPNGTVINDRKIPFMLIPSIPTITGLDPATATYGTGLTVEGTGFGPQAELILSSPDSKILWLPYAVPTGPQNSTDRYIFTVISEFPVPLEGLNLSVVVRNPKTQSSDPVTLKLEPYIITRCVPTNAITFVLGGPGDWEYESLSTAVQYEGYEYYGKIRVHHSSDILFGHKGDDVFILNRLCNGWKLHEVVCRQWYNGKDCNADNPPHVTVSTHRDAQGRDVAQFHWWVDAPVNQVDYWPDFWIEGPDGLSPWK
jgi:hypothetical protein